MVFFGSNDCLNEDTFCIVSLSPQRIGGNVRQKPMVRGRVGEKEGGRLSTYVG